MLHFLIPVIRGDNYKDVLESVFYRDNEHPRIEGGQLLIELS